MSESTYRARMEQKLQAEFSPIHMEIKDDSAKHAGHAGHNPLGETHFSLKIVSAKFDGLSAVARHKMIYQTLDSELKERVHALSIQALSRSEYNHE